MVKSVPTMETFSEIKILKGSILLHLYASHMTLHSTFSCHLGAMEPNLFLHIGCAISDDGAMPAQNLS